MGTKELFLLPPPSTALHGRLPATINFSLPSSLSSSPSSVFLPSFLRLLSLCLLHLLSHLLGHRDMHAQAFPSVTGLLPTPAECARGLHNSYCGLAWWARATLGAHPLKRHSGCLLRLGRGAKALVWELEVCPVPISAGRRGQGLGTVALIEAEWTSGTTPITCACPCTFSVPDRRRGSG